MPTDKKSCKNCGRDIKIEDVYCEYCGAQVQQKEDKISYVCIKVYRK